MSIIIDIVVTSWLFYRLLVMFYLKNDSLTKTELNATVDDIASVPLSSISTLIFFRFYELKTGSPIPNNDEIYRALKFNPTSSFVD